MTIPWSFQAHTRPGSVERAARGWLAREGSWDPFYRETWESAPSRAPWRILPRGGLRLVVGEEDALDLLIYDRGPRFLEVDLGAVLSDWSGQRGETFRIRQASLLFSDRESPGVFLDMARAWRAEDVPPGDWAFVTSGDSIQLVLEQPEEREGPAAAGQDDAPFRAWARMGNREIQWPAVQVSWRETRAFERARRVVPVAWSVSSGDGELEGRLAVETPYLEAGRGDGPLLPVDAVYEVTGSIRIQGRPRPVRGLFRHLQR